MGSPAIPTSAILQSSDLHFDGHALLVGPNNVGKSTICEALDLALGPDRLNKSPPVEEFDFYNGKYLEHHADPKAEAMPIPIRIEVILIDLSAEIINKCGGHLEFWHLRRSACSAKAKLPLQCPRVAIPCLRLETVAQYDPAEDEFTAETQYTHSPNNTDGGKDTVRREIKRLIGAPRSPACAKVLAEFQDRGVFPHLIEQGHWQLG